MRRRAVGRAVAVAILAAVSPGCASPVPDPGTPARQPSSTGSGRPVETDADAVAAARSRLADLAVVDRDPDALPPYSRDAFGPAWADTDGNGCNQRDDVLLRDAVAGTVRRGVQGPCDHDVLAGTWLDSYTGATLVFDDLKDPAQAQAIQIDHVVPLAEAWRSGASEWDEPRRREFANDLDVLLAVDGPVNAAKGDDDPAAWRPRRAHQCAYAVRWITVKARWELGADASEARALAEQLETCGT